MDRAKKKKIAASIAAIMHYESGFAAAPAEAERPPVAQLPPAFWGVAGRQDQMSMRAFWQRRLVKSW
ncbi:hypothetical protein EPN96_05715 [bacterium]|nr:MAG: hypothetical protein EPN96_05715 [bacterium]